MRDEHAREWAAELDAIARESHQTRLARVIGPLRFAVSLAISPPVLDEHGVPRGWRELLPGLGKTVGPYALLFVVALVVSGPLSSYADGIVRWIASVVGVTDPSGFGGGFGFADVFTALVMVGAGWWLGRRAARAPRFGVVGLVSAASLSLTAAFTLQQTAFAAQVGEMYALRVGSAVTGGLSWAILSAVCTLAVVRMTMSRHRVARRSAWVLAVFGVLVTVELATAIAAVPSILHIGGDLGMAFEWAPAILSGQTSGTEVNRYVAEENWVVSNILGPYPEMFVLLSVLVIVYGVAGSRARVDASSTEPVLPTSADPARPVSLSRGLFACALTSMSLALIAWAYSVAVLTPAMTKVSQTAPMPGGDGELFVWVAELRWGAILLAAASLLLAAADRHASPLAAFVLVLLLIGGDSVLGRDASPDLRVALVVAALSAAVAWWISSEPGMGGGRADVVRARRRLAVVAITGACCGPLLLFQGTPTVNHPFLPPGLVVATAMVPALFAVLSGLAAAAAVDRRLSRWWVAVLIGVPTVLLGLGGAATGSGIDLAVTQLVPIALAGPFAAAVVAVLFNPRSRRRGRNAAVRTAILVAGLPVSVVVFFVSIVLSQFAASILFALGGTSYPADGITFLPGAVLLVVPAAWALSLLVAGPGPARHVSVDAARGLPAPEAG
ncbi:hypothetical protein [Asanoa ishikariensis]|uniref:hypothetical protein n=1 Tax=Asanoa ishikariensis TaxID=137265 RepID=UPI0015A3716A|nr:hypothetical protein [Asanoa ishikariensis]